VTYNRSLSFLSADNPSPSYLQIYTAGALGGLATYFVSTPTELIKVRAQVANDGTPTSTGASRSSSLWIAKETWKREGLRGLYLGGGVTAWRDAIGYGFYFCSYDLSKRLMSTASDPNAEHLAQWKILLCGGIAGVVTWASIFPLDVIKTRIQSQALLPRKGLAVSTPPQSPSHEPLVGNQATGANYGVRRQPVSPGSPGSQSSVHSAVVPLRQSTLAITLNMYRAEGLSVFFRGLGICSVRAFIVNAVQWAVYEWVMVVLVPKKGVQHS
jgi:solute carrier family 25 carnitine/acylcarnitine transporter 20/29